jgi:hypothetical protein
MSIAKLIYEDNYLMINNFIYHGELYYQVQQFDSITHRFKLQTLSDDKVFFSSLSPKYLIYYIAEVIQCSHTVDL